MPARFGKLVYERKGKPRGPFSHFKRGPSPWGVFVKQRMEEPTKREAERRLQQEVIKRTKFVLLRYQGAIK